ncbi:MAG: 50S ribosomal protein L22 [Patescibacteria group bacterium]
MRAKLSYLRIAPRKTRMVADLIRGKTVEEAQTILKFTVKKSSLPILKLLKSAVASAVNNFKLEELNLKIAKIVVDGGPMLKRWRPRARGRAFPIQKKTSNVTIILEEIEKSEEKKIEKKKAIKTIEKTVKIVKTKADSKEEKEENKEDKDNKAKINLKDDRLKRSVKPTGKRFFRRKSF